MKKTNLFFVLVMLLMITSCKVQMNTSDVLPLNAQVNLNCTADLEVSENKIKYEYIPSKEERKLGLEWIKSNAVYAALEKYGNADVLVSPQFSITKKCSKILLVKVSGYPAYYKNIRVLEPTDHLAD